MAETPSSFLLNEIGGIIIHRSILYRPEVSLFLQFDILCFIKRRNIGRYFDAISSSQEKSMLFMYLGTSLLFIRYIAHNI